MGKLYKVGTKVKIVRLLDADMDDQTDHHGVVGKVYEIKKNNDGGVFKYRLKDCPVSEAFRHEELEEVSNMGSIKEKVKLITMSPDNRVLYKRGLIDGSGDLTDDGKDALWSLLFDENKAKLVELAKAIKAEEDADKKAK